MRLLLLVCLFPWVLIAQQESPGSSSQNFLQRNNIQVGIFAQRDASPPTTYTFKGPGLIPRLRREALLGVTLSGRPFKKFPSLQPRLRFGYEHIDHTGDYLDIGRNWFGENFTERISYDHWQLAIGFHLDIMPTYLCSPFFGAHYLVVLPDHLRYVAQRDFDPDVDIPIYTELNGGGKLSQGWEINTGLRWHIARHWNLELGIYYSELDIKKDWPILANRNIAGNKLFTNQTIGFMLATQYRW